MYTYAEKYADTGLMVNSIRAGMTIIMLVALQRDRDRYLSQAQSDNIISLPLAARGESPASHRGRRSARFARREEGKYREYSTDEPRREAGCSAGRMQGAFHHGLLALKDPVATFFCSVSAALGASIVTTMAAVLSYEYVGRFRWNEWKEHTHFQGWPKIELAKKAYRFDTFGFYCLMWSLAVVPVLLNYYVSLISIFFMFTVMWYFYFFGELQTRHE